MMPELFLKNNLGVNRNCKIGSVTHEEKIPLTRAQVILQDSLVKRADLPP